MPTGRLPVLTDRRVDYVALSLASLASSGARRFASGGGRRQPRPRRRHLLPDLRSRGAQCEAAAWQRYLERAQRGEARARFDHQGGDPRHYRPRHHRPRLHLPRRCHHPRRLLARHLHHHPRARHRRPHHLHCHPHQVEPQQSLTTGGMSSSTFETDEPREIGTQSRQGFRLTVSGGRVSVSGGRVSKLVALACHAGLQSRTSRQAPRRVLFCHSHVRAAPLRRWHSPSSPSS